MNQQKTNQSHPTSHLATNLTPTQQNLADIKNALEQIMLATAESTVSRASASPADTANIARLHSFASDAYAQLMTVMAGKSK